MLNVPSPTSVARFPPAFGQRVLLTVDTEEEFDWNGPFQRDGYGLSHVGAIPRFQAFCERLGAHPVYLVDWPIVSDARAIEVIKDAVHRGMADVGVQLHPWVNPPFDEDVCAFNSYAGNLPGALEAEKFMLLRDAIEGAFGSAPLIYRAGRYGLGPHTAELLTRAGIKIDTSVRSLFDYSQQGGPDYTSHPLTPYWVDSSQRLLEIPVTTVHSGALRGMGAPVQRLVTRIKHGMGMLSRLGLLERIALTPEGVASADALRAIDLALDQDLPVLVLSFHSPSLAPGHTPYARTTADVEKLYEWFETVYAHLALRGVKSCTVSDILTAIDE
ncbi:polysaccharide deacetylase family protein [Erythrobacter sp. R86502]|uniref:polysaccharide deacetylase family protein n=1 Tax=Erythrobacter sp. R86502 TaxID=3093846 RepID=UPI0036D26D8D